MDVPRRFVSDDCSRLYSLERRVGQGGHGRVFEAKVVGDKSFDGRSSDLVVVKFAHDLPIAREALRTEREAYSCPDPGVVRLYDAGCAQGYEFLVLERLKEPPFKVLSGGERKPLPAGLAIDTYVNLLDVLARLHTREQEPIALLDIKPGNIMVRMGGEVDSLEEYVSRLDEGRYQPVFMDMGCARPLELLEREDGRLPKAVGTVVYWAPEVCPSLRIDAPKSGRYHAGADVYALTLSFYELLTGLKPFQYRGLWAITHFPSFLVEVFEHLEEKTPPLDMKYLREDLRRFQPGIGRRLARDMEDVVRWGLQPDPSLRPTALELLDLCMSCFKVESRAVDGDEVRLGLRQGVTSSAVDLR